MKRDKGLKKDSIFFYAVMEGADIKYATNMTEFTLKALQEFLNNKIWEMQQKRERQKLGECT